MSLTQLRIGMIGVNGRGGLWRHWHDPKGRSVVVGGADIVPEYLDAFRRENGGNPFITEDYRELVARPDIDTIAVTSPDYCHEEHAVAALQAGKHVFCEKPMTITIEGCRSRAGSLAHIGHTADGRLQHAVYEHLPRDERDHRVRRHR